jgi:hypothetical protein
MPPWAGQRVQFPRGANCARIVHLTSNTQQQIAQIEHAGTPKNTPNNILHKNLLGSSPIRDLPEFAETG